MATVIERAGAEQQDSDDGEDAAAIRVFVSGDSATSTIPGTLSGNVPRCNQPRSFGFTASATWATCLHHDIHGG